MVCDKGFVHGSAGYQNLKLVLRNLAECSESVYGLGGPHDRECPIPLLSVRVGSDSDPPIFTKAVPSKALVRARSQKYGFSMDLNKAGFYIGFLALLLAVRYQLQQIFSHLGLVGGGERPAQEGARNEYPD